MSLSFGILGKTFFSSVFPRKSNKADILRHFDWVVDRTISDLLHYGVCNVAFPVCDNLLEVIGILYFNNV